MSIRKLITSSVIMTNSILSAKQNNGFCSSSIGYWKWDVMSFIQTQTEKKINYAVVILNRPITQNEGFFLKFWNNASVRITVDGGTKHFDTLVNKEINNSMKIPDLVTGDFDSIIEVLLQKYKLKGSKVIHTPDQNYTDFTKSLLELNHYCMEKCIHIDHVIAIGQASGRIDQTMGNIQTLFLAKEKKLLNQNTSLYLMSDDSISWLLPPGEHCINIPVSVREHSKVWCSLVPIGEECKSVTTRGLKWDLDKQTLRFGDLVSTSNTFTCEKEVNITCSHTLLWSMKLPQLLGSRIRADFQWSDKIYLRFKDAISFFT